MAKTATSARASSTRRINLSPLKLFDWEAWKSKFGKKQEPYDIKDTRPKYEQLQRSYQMAGSDRTVIYNQQGVGYGNYKKSPARAIQNYAALFQSYKLN